MKIKQFGTADSLNIQQEYLDCNLHFLHDFTGPKFGLITRRKTENVESDLRKMRFLESSAQFFLRNYGCL